MTKAKDSIDFIGIGSPRCGTTWIAACLQEHPQILFSGKRSLKELNFFNDAKMSEFSYVSNHDKGLSWYLRQLPPPEDGKIRGEFSVSYLSDKNAPSRIKRAFPHTKIIVSLREPISSAYSMHWYMKSAVLRKAPEDFEKAIEEGFYMDKVLYYKLLKRYYDLFPKRNILVIIYEDISKNPEKVTQRLYSFLGVDSSFKPAVLFKQVNKATESKNELLAKLASLVLLLLKRFSFSIFYKRVMQSDRVIRLYNKINKRPVPGYPPLDPAVRSKLTPYFAKDVRKLSKLIGRDLTCWGI